MAGGRRGPPPQPTNKLRLAGSPLADKRKDEPEYQTGEFGPTMVLDAESQAEWDRVYPQLQELGIAAPINAFPLTLLCTLAGSIARLQTRVAKEGPVVEGTRGPKRNPADQTLDAKVIQYTRLCQEFGLTPASKTRVVSAPQDKKQSKAKRFGL